MKATRDLEKDLAICMAITSGRWVRVGMIVLDTPEADAMQVAKADTVRDAQFIAEACVGWPHAIRRALQAEEYIETLECRIDSMRDEIRMLNDQLNQGGRRYG